MTASWAPAQTATVFGGTGFLGRRVVRRLREAGFAVRITARHPERGRSLSADGEPGIASIRMASEDGQQTYRWRKLTERAHGIIKNRGMSRFLVHGLEKVRAVCLRQALALNLCWANTLRRRIAAAAAMAIPANA